MDTPRYILFAGVNGSGKTTLYHVLSDLPNIPYVNIDDEIREKGDWRDIHINLEVGRDVVLRIHSYLKDRQSFIGETTLCGKSILKNIQSAHDAGYKIDIFYVGLNSPELAKQRVHNRMAHGGHGISDEDIERRYYASFENLNSILPLCHSVTFFDNTDRFQKIAIYTNGAGLIFDSNVPLPSWFTTYIRI